jgi:uncharacterized protein
MELTPLIPGDRQVIAGYGKGMFRVSGVVYSRSILVFPDRTLEWPVGSFDDVNLDSFAAILASDPPVEVLLLGTGSRHEFMPPSMRRELRDAGIVLDTMDTGAACRTYNVLMAEDRRVAAALIVLE